MSDGPWHYREAERLVTLAAINLDRLNGKTATIEAGDGGA